MVIERRRPDRGPWQPARPDPPPPCPGCGGPLDMGRTEADQLVACCLHPPCREWIIFARDEGGRWRITERIPTSQRSATGGVGRSSPTSPAVAPACPSTGH